jgi:hypothetical protein
VHDGHRGDGSGGEALLEAWAAGGSPPHDLDRLLALFSDDVVYEDVALGVVNLGNEQPRAFFGRVFAGPRTSAVSSGPASSPATGARWNG